MKVTRRQLRQIIKEEIATVTDDAIEDVVMSVLSDEGGAAGAEPIEDALEDLEDNEISLPDEDIEDIIGDVTGVKRHADGDYIDTTQLESRRMKITKRQLRRIIKEEYRRVLKEGGYDQMAADVKELYQDGIDPRAAGEKLSTMYDEMDLQAGLDMGMFGPSWMSEYVEEIIEELNDPTDLYDEPDRYGGSRRRY